MSVEHSQVNISLNKAEAAVRTAFAGVQQDADEFTQAVTQSINKETSEIASRLSSIIRDAQSTPMTEELQNIVARIDGIGQFATTHAASFKEYMAAKEAALTHEIGKLSDAPSADSTAANTAASTDSAAEAATTATDPAATATDALPSATSGGDSTSTPPSEGGATVGVSVTT